MKSNLSFASPVPVQCSHVNSKHDPANAGLDADLLLAFQHLCKYLQSGYSTESEVANYADTPVRAAKAFASMHKSREEIIERLNDILSTGFPREHKSADYSAGMVTQGPIQVFSSCPHHLLPVEYEVYVAYIPVKDNGLVLGLSKLARIAKILGERPILQEQLAADIADVLFSTSEGLAAYAFPSMVSQGSAVLLTGRHSCMACRGVNSAALTSVTELRGSFWKEDMETKFYQAVQAINNCGLRRA